MLPEVGAATYRTFMLHDARSPMVAIRPTPVIQFAQKRTVACYGKRSLKPSQLGQADRTFDPLVGSVTMVPLSPPVLHAANVIARALIPVFGILFLGWSGGKVLLVYFADTLGSMYAVSVLAAYAATQSEPEFQAWIKDGITPLKHLRIVVGAALIGFLAPVMVAIPFGGFLAIFLSIQDFAWSEALADRSLWISIGCQFVGTVTIMMGQLHWIATLRDPGRLVRARTGLLFARWVAMLLVGVLAMGLPREIYLALVVLAYAAGTVALELVPERVLSAMNAQDLLDALTPRKAEPAGAPGDSRATDAVSKSVMRHFQRQGRK